MGRLWVYKCNVNHQNSGDWDYFFDHRAGRGRCGGTYCINDPSSRRILLEELQRGDFILAWQTDRRAALGLCKVAKLPRKGEDVDIFLTTVQRFPAPVKLLQWKKESKPLARGKAFVSGRQGTLFETNPDEAQDILRLCGANRQVRTKPKPRPTSRPVRRPRTVAATAGNPVPVNESTHEG